VPVPVVNNVSFEKTPQTIVLFFESCSITLQRLKNKMVTRIHMDDENLKRLPINRLWFVHLSKEVSKNELGLIDV
jgi:hypothetical protein